MAQVEIYTTPMCPFCRRAKMLLESKGVDYTEINVMLNPIRRREMTKRAGGHHTVPQIFVDGEYLGDCDGIHRMNAAGTLDAALKLNGA